MSERVANARSGAQLSGTDDGNSCQFAPPTFIRHARSRSKRRPPCPRTTTRSFRSIRGYALSFQPGAATSRTRGMQNVLGLIANNLSIGL